MLRSPRYSRSVQTASARECEDLSINFCIIAVIDARPQLAAATLLRIELLVSNAHHVPARYSSDRGPDVPPHGQIAAGLYDLSVMPPTILTAVGHNRRLVVA